jgi:hypothetical protein
MVGGGLFLALCMAIPLGLPIMFMLGWRVDWAALASDRQLHVGLVWQCAAAVWSYVGLYQALRTATPEALRLRQRFTLVFLRWMALVVVAYSPLALLIGGHGALVFVAIYIVVSIWAELAPDHFLRVVPGGVEDAEHGPRVEARPRRRNR